MNNLSTLKQFGFRWESSNASTIILKEDLPKDISTEEVLSEFFGGRVSYTNAYGVFPISQYPFPIPEGYYYVEVATTPNRGMVKPCIEHLNTELVKSTGLTLPVYVAVNFMHMNRNLTSLERTVNTTIMDKVIYGTLNAYSVLYPGRKFVIKVENEMTGSSGLYMNRTYIPPSKAGQWKYQKAANLQIIRGAVALDLVFGISQEYIVDLVRNAQSQTEKFLADYSPLLVVFYLPFFMLLFYGSSTLTRDLEDELKLLRIRRIGGDNVRNFQMFIILALTGAVVLATGYAVSTIQGVALSSSTTITAIIVTYATILISGRVRSLSAGRKLTITFLILLAVFIGLGIARINQQVLMAKGLEILAVLLSFLLALVPIIGIFLGVFLHRATRGILDYMSKAESTAYHARILEKYAVLLTFSAYAISFMPLSRIVNLNAIFNQILSNPTYRPIIGYGQASLLPLMQQYLTDITRIFSGMGIVSIAVLVYLLALGHLKLLRYSRLRGINTNIVNRNFTRFTGVGIAALLLLTVVSALMLLVFIDAYIGMLYTTANLQVAPSGHLISLGVFRPYHVWM